MLPKGRVITFVNDGLRRFKLAKMQRKPACLAILTGLTLLIAMIMHIGLNTGRNLKHPSGFGAKVRLNCVIRPRFYDTGAS
jgi:hypothetical protein